MSSSGGREGSARVMLRTHPLWRLRLMREAPRYVLGALSLFGLLASARYAIAPPRPAAPVAGVRAGAATDLAAAGYAVEFVRRYLAWRATEPVSSAGALESFAGPEMATAAGLVLPAAGAEQVEWAEVVQAREPETGLHVFTVAAQTDEGMRYVAVPVERTDRGSLALADYPAFVGPPASAPAAAPARLAPVGEQSLEVVVRRGLRNYLSASTAELAADLSEGARVAVPASPLRLISAEHAQWAPGGGSVLVLVQAADALGARYTLSYEVDVARVQGRWEISAIETDPDA